MRVVLIAGEIAVGKSAVATALGEQTGAGVLSARSALHELLDVSTTNRVELQRRGAELDRRTSGRWLLEYLREHYGGSDVVVDSLRTRRQTLPILNQETDSRLVYLTASEQTRRRRYQAGASASDQLKASSTFDRAMSHPTEIEVRLLRPMAHLVLETDQLGVADVVAEIVANLY